jgi:hypothetical protein
MKTRKFIIGASLMIIAIFTYGCLGITERVAEPTQEEQKEFTEITWEDLKDVNFGVSLKYPSDWEMAKNDTGFLTFTPKTEVTDEPSPYFIKIVKLDNYDNKTLAEYLNLDKDYEMSKIGVDELVATKLLEPPDSLSHFYYVDRSPFVYKFVYMNLSDDNDYISNQVFYEILNSFRFIPFTVEEEEEEEVDEEGEDVEEEASEDEAVVEEVVEEDSDAEEATAEETDEEASEEEAVEEEVATEEETPAVEEEVVAEEEEETTPTDNMHYFISGPYNFKALYPSNWYYTGAHLGGANNVLHRYSFSEQPDAESILTMDIVDEPMPSGAVDQDGYKISKVTGGGKIVIYIQIDEQVYKISAGNDLEDTANAMALSIIETE